MKLGLQLFTLIDTMKQPGGLRTVIKYAAECGYDGVEFAGFYDMTPEEIAEELKANHLETAGIHLGWEPMCWDNLDKDPQKVIDTAKLLGAQSVTVASYPGKSLSDWVEFAKKMDTYGKLFRENGMLLGYHNHRIEAKKLDGRYIIDIIMENCSPENVFWELDPRHICVAGEDPVAFAARYCGRIPLLHMRDIEKITGEDSALDTAVGSGIVDIAGVVKASGHHDWLVVEEASCPEILEHVKRSADFIRKTLLV